MSTADATLDLESVADSAVRPAGPGRLTGLRQRVLPPVVVVVAVLLGWALVVRLAVRPESQLPSPADVWRTFVALWSDGTAATAVWNSLRRAAVGFLLSVAIATPVGLLLARFRPLRAGVAPLLAGLQALPSVAWVPAAILWFGHGDAAIYAVVLAGAVPSIVTGLLSGARLLPASQLRVGRALGLTGWRETWHVVLPGVLPAYLSGLRLGWAFAWRALMAAELIDAAAGASPTLGRVLQAGKTHGDQRLVLAGVLLVLLVGLAVELLVFAPLEHRLVRSRGGGG